MSDPNQEFQPPPPPPSPPPVVATEPERQRPVKLMWAGVALFVLGIIIAVVGFVGYMTGGTWTGVVVCGLGILFFAFSFMRLPSIPGAPPPMSTTQTLTGIFFEPTNVFRNLRAHPRWLAAILIVGILNAAYITAFTRRLTPERIINYTADKLDEGALKPPPEVLAKMRTEGVEQAKSRTYQVGVVIQKIVSAFFSTAFIAALCLLGVLAFGGRMHFWQTFAVVAYVGLPVTVIQKVISLIILYIKSPDDIHPILHQDNLLYDNLGLLVAAKDHPVLFVVASSIGLLSFYGLWLTATGLREGGYKVGSSAGWGVAITLFVLFLLLGVAVAVLFGSFFG